MGKEMKEKVICPNLLCRKEIEFDAGEKDFVRVTCSCGTILVVPIRKAKNGTKDA